MGLCGLRPCTDWSTDSGWLWFTHFLVRRKSCTARKATLRHTHPHIISDSTTQCCPLKPQFFTQLVTEYPHPKSNHVFIEALWFLRRYCKTGKTPGIDESHSCYERVFTQILRTRSSMSASTLLYQDFITHPCCCQWTGNYHPDIG